MKRLSMNLPPFAPDYSGACSALYPLDSTVVIHDASGCTGNYTAFDEPRWYGSRKPVYCSGLRKMDAVFGNEEALLERIVRAWEVQRSAMVAVVGSPVPMVIGTDFDGLAREIERRTGVPAFGFSTTGTKLYPQGVAMACKAVIERFARRDVTPVADSVNILGVTPLDMGPGNLQALKESFVRSGFSVNCCCAAEWSLTSIAQIGAAQINVAVTQAGVEIARFLEDRFGTPWLAGMPVGQRGAAAFFERLSRLAKGEAAPPFPEIPAWADAVAAGDWVMSASLCQAMFLDGGIEAVPVGLFGKTGLTFQAVTPEDEDGISAAVSKAKLLAADPLICALANEAERIEIPQYAVSSRLCCERLYMDKHFTEILFKGKRKEGSR